MVEENKPINDQKLTEQDQPIPIEKKCSRCGEIKLLSEFSTHESSFSICKNCLANDLDESSSEDWDHIADLTNLIERTLHENHVQFGGKMSFSNMSAIAACYAVIDKLSSNFVSDFGIEVIEPLIDRLDTFQNALHLNLNKFRDR